VAHAHNKRITLTNNIKIRNGPIGKYLGTN
jgi:hypothetical protein